MSRYRNVPTDVSFRLPEFTTDSYTDLSKLVAEFRRREDARMTAFLDGCIQIAANVYLTEGASEKLREYLGDALPHSFGMYELRRDLPEIPLRWVIDYGSWRLVARSLDIFPEEIPLFPDEDGNVFFVIRGGDRP
ncbi:MAG: hypothetical protein ACQEUO_16280 [Bacillota bacterium]|uniref:Uncharacterized protein n=1 Tax=Bacillus pumilus TaxID=1408 RepID=A0A2G8ITK3_BACPU|nr:hypothetical protein [Bacillus pumilus]PIK26803.1 hypothetical protein CTV99_10705 [Bacillus pumilus]